VSQQASKAFMTRLVTHSQPGIAEFSSPRR
jgi:hypothetical protein